tara:strand:+ start:844 stop:1113 length:270 start_codon:yes stop_codon:yes gene_type:complete
MNIQEIKSGVLGLDNNELNEIISTINYRRKELNRQVKNQFSVGDRVWFNSRKGTKIEGEITKINRKNIVVKQDDSFTSWNVSPSLLEKG